jgi:hypothetical protein
MKYPLSCAIGRLAIRVRPAGVRKVFGWDRFGSWRVIADPEGQARAQQRERMNDLVF